MLTCKVGKNIIDTFSYKNEQLREWSNKGLLKCPVCGEKMIYCHGDYKIPYFRHEKDTDCPDIYSEGITQEHINGIKIIYEWLKEQKDVTDIQLEKWIEETHQRPDIYFKFNDEEYVIEYQCSPISTQYAKRHDLYRLQGIKDIWILGTEKYDIGAYEWLDIIEGRHIEVKNIKTKTIERELYNNNKSVYYLKNNSLVKIKRFLNIRDLKTMFDIFIDCVKIDSINIKTLVYYKIIDNNFKFNNILNEFKMITSNLNTHAIYDYKNYYKANYNKIKFEIHRNYKCIFDIDYLNYNEELLHSEYNKQLIEISKEKDKRKEEKEKIEKLKTNNYLAESMVKEYIINNEMKKYYSNFSIYYNGYGNVVIKASPIHDYGNKCWRISVLDCANDFKLEEIKTNMITKGKNIEDKYIKNVEKSDFKEINKIIKEINTDLIFKTNYYDGISLYINNTEIKEVMSYDSFCRRNKPSINTFLRNYINTNLKKDYLKYIQNQLKEIKNNLINKYGCFEKINLIPISDLYKYYLNNDIKILNLEFNNYKNKYIEDIINDIKEFYKNKYNTCGITIECINSKNCLFIIINKVGLARIKYLLKIYNNKIFIINKNKYINNKKELKLEIENDIRYKLYK